MADLFDPLTLRETELRNRVMVSPMCQYSCEGRDGLATDWHLVHLGSRATGGAGLVMAEATAVEPRGRISPRDLGIWSDEHAAALEPVSKFVRSQGATPGIQLAHAGRKGSKTRPQDGSEPLKPDEEGGYRVVSASEDPYPYDDATAPPTDALGTEEVEGVVDAFADAAERARDAGFEVVEVHAAHGYLLHQFLSPVTNDRDDRYGGEFDGRTRLVREVTAAVRAVWPDDAPVFVRISATDWLPDRGSWTVEDSERLAPRLAEAGANLIDVSAGGIHPDQELPGYGPGYQIPFAERVRAACDLPVGAVGSITEPTHADALIRNERADLAVVGREHLRDPYFANHAAEALDEAPDWPLQYDYAIGR